MLVINLELIKMFAYCTLIKLPKSTVNTQNSKVKLKSLMEEKHWNIIFYPCQAHFCSQNIYYHLWQIFEIWKIFYVLAFFHQTLQLMIHLLRRHIFFR